MASLPTSFDNTMLSCFSTCPVKFYFQYVRCWSKQKYPAPTFGIAIHAGLAEWYLGKTANEAVRRFEEVFKEEFAEIEDWKYYSLELGMDILEAYFKFWSDEPEPEIVEEGFAVNLFKMGELNFSYIGRIDLVIKWPPWGKVIIDHKTTAAIPRLAPIFSQQLMGYCWALGVGAASLNYIATKKIDFMRTEPVMFNSNVLNAWLVSTIAKVRQILDCWVHMQWPHNFAACYQYFRPCQYMELCKLGKPAHEISKPSSFKKVIWEPFKHARKVITLEVSRCAKRDTREE